MICPFRGDECVENCALWDRIHCGCSIWVIAHSLGLMVHK